MRKTMLGIIACFLILVSALPAFAAGEKPVVFVIPVTGTIDNVLIQSVEKGFAEAQKEQASLVVLKIDTYGGYVDAAIAVKNTIIANDTNFATLAFVDGKAISAGALIALSGQTMVMTPGGTIGAAEPRAGGLKADEKVLSMWRTELASAAEARGRSGEIAAAMADSDIELPGLKEKGKLLTLTATQAVELGMADGIVSNLNEAIRFSLGTDDVQIMERQTTPTEKWAAFLTNPAVSMILLTLGILGIVLEIMLAGFGIAGVIGIFSFGLFFAGSFLAGYSAWFSVTLFLIGIILLVLEIFVIPGFGVTGASGVAAVILGVILASPNIGQAILSLLFAIAVTVIIVIITLKNKKTRKIWGRLILAKRQENKAGYAAQSQEIQKYLAMQGVAATTLRPSGTGVFAGERVDVVTEGEFITSGAAIEVIKVEGTRVVVREIK